MEIRVVLDRDRAVLSQRMVDWAPRTNEAVRLICELVLLARYASEDDLAAAAERWLESASIEKKIE